MCRDDTFYNITTATKMTFVFKIYSHTSFSYTNLHDMYSKCMLWLIIRFTYLSILLLLLWRFSYVAILWSPIRIVPLRVRYLSYTAFPNWLSCSRLSLWFSNLILNGVCVIVLWCYKIPDQLPIPAEVWRWIGRHRVLIDVTKIESCYSMTIAAENT